MSVEYLEELIPLHLRKRYNIISQTKLHSLGNGDDNIICRKCFDESHETVACNKDWIKCIYPNTLEEIISSYDKLRYNITTKTPLLIDKLIIESPPIVFIPENHHSIYNMAKKFKLQIPKKNDGYNKWTVMAELIRDWCKKTDREYVIYKECIDIICAEENIEVDVKSNWETKAEAIKKWGEKHGREIVIEGEPISIDDDRLKINLLEN